MNSIRKIIKKIIRPNHYSNEAYITYLRRNGAIIGDKTYFYGPEKHPVDESSLPWIEIGDCCRITSGVLILAHDYSYAVLRKKYHCMMPKIGKTKIGSNVFLGMNSIILMGTTIGDNVIVGAGSIVSGVIPSDVVIAGNPARIICSLDDYYEKNRKNFLKYSIEHYNGMKKYLNRDLVEEEMGWYVALWESEKKKKIVEKLKVDGDYKDEVISDVCSYPSIYSSFDDYVKKNDLVDFSES